jgi:hypothetical protein
LFAGSADPAETILGDRSVITGKLVAVPDPN